MNKQITIQFTPDSTVEFVGEECADKYETAVLNVVKYTYPGVEVEITNDSPFGTKISAYGFDKTETDIQQSVTAILERIGNNLNEICN